MNTSFDAEGVVVRRGAFVLGPLDLRVADGEYVVVVGPSGAGKTVLLETLLGWHEPDAGEVRLDGTPVRAIAPGARSVAYVPQDLALLPHLGVRENLEFWLRCRGESPDSAWERELVDVLELAPLLDRPDPRTLSRGEQQRVMLGRALLTRPARLLLDEPCAPLDSHLRREFQLLLRSLQGRLGTTVVHVTHDREEAFLLGHRVAVVLGGKLCQVGPPVDLYLRPACSLVARFLGPENLWPVTWVAERDGHDVFRLVGHDHEFELAGPPRETASNRGALLFGIRPEEVMVLHPERPLRPQVQHNIVEGTIVEHLMLEGRVQVRIETGAGLGVTARLPFCAALDMDLRVGARARASLKPRSSYVVSDRCP